MGFKKLKGEPTFAFNDLSERDIKPLGISVNQREELTVGQV